MNKLFTFFASAALIGSLSACSNDEPSKNGPDEPQVITGDAAYLAVKIVSAGNASRTVSDESGYEFGSEHEVHNAKFFFFDEDGNYVLEAKIINNPNFTDGDKETNDNVEYLDEKSVLVLDGLTDKGNYPSYMLTVINKPNFKAETTLTATLNSAKSDYINTMDEKSYYVMSTSSYSDPNEKHTIGAEEVTHDDFYFTTRIDPSNFKETSDAALQTTPVDVYVERLAAKVSLTIGVTDAAKKKSLGEDRTIYKLSSTVGEGPNEGSELATTELWIEVLDWDLGGVTKESYMSKQIDITNWNATGADFESWVKSGNVTWNDPSRFRSYWAESVVYGQTPETLGYANNSSLKALDQPRYCNENTNKVNNIFIDNNETTTKVNPAYVTHATIHARICNENGEYQPMVRANGTLYKPTAYIKNILSRYTLDHTITLGVNKTETTVDGTTTIKCDPIDETYFKFVRAENETEVGKTTFEFDSDKVKDTDVYKFENGSWSENALSAEDLATEIAALNAALLKEQNEFVGAGKFATIYDGGHFVYYVPIEHFGAKAGNQFAIEGYYGVVRNHWYNLTITEFTNVGHGIWDPEKYEETYKPNGPQEYYYLGARINILSWKIVNQSVAL